MKKIINDKRYNTDTAKALAVSSCNIGKISQVVETLYRKNTGEYFLHCEGGPATKYARFLGNNSWTSGEMILPLTLSEAEAWSKDHISEEDFSRIFDHNYDPEKKTITLRLSKAARRALKDMASEGNTSMSEIVEALILH